MKICIAATTDIAFDQRVVKIATSLVKHGHTVTVIGRQKKNSLNISFPFNVELLSCWIPSSFLFYAEFNLRLFFKVFFKSNDVFCSCDLDTLPALATASLLKQKKLVFDAHEYFEESVEIVNKKFIQTIWEWIGKIFIPLTHLRYTVSTSLAGELSTKYKKKFYLIRNLPNKLPQNRELKKTHIIWYQGAINEGRGLECMIDLMKDLPDYIFKLAGEGDILDALRNQVARNHLEARVVFLGKLKPEDLIPNAMQSFIGIDLLESRSKSYYYSLSNKTFDYIQAGLPCIRMKFPEYIELDRQFQTGVLINSIERSVILDAIHKLEDEKMYQHCVSECNKAAQIFNWEAEEKILVSLYNELDS